MLARLFLFLKKYFAIVFFALSLCIYVLDAKYEEYKNILFLKSNRILNFSLNEIQKVEFIKNNKLPDSEQWSVELISGKMARFFKRFR